MAPPRRRPGTVDVRRTYRYQVAARRVVAAGYGKPCPHCGQPLTPGMPPGHPLEVCADHIIPVSSLAGAGIDQADDAALQAMHRGCNSSKGNRMPGDVTPRAHRDEHHWRRHDHAYDHCTHCGHYLTHVEGLIVSAPW